MPNVIWTKQKPDYEVIMSYWRVFFRHIHCLCFWVLANGTVLDGWMLISILFRLNLSNPTSHIGVSQNGASALSFCSFSIGMMRFCQPSPGSFAWFPGSKSWCVGTVEALASSKSPWKSHSSSHFLPSSTQFSSCSPSFSPLLHRSPSFRIFAPDSPSPQDETSRSCIISSAAKASRWRLALRPSETMNRVGAQGVGVVVNGNPKWRFPYMISYDPFLGRLHPFDPDFSQIEFPREFGNCSVDFWEFGQCLDVSTNGGTQK